MPALMVFFVMVLFAPALKEDSGNSALFLWDVGQGQWVTVIKEETCDHFDAGGEFFPKDVLKICAGRLNRLSISHWDKDHTSLVWQARKSGLDLCIAELPLSAPPGNLKGLLQWKKCRERGDFETFKPEEISKQQNNNSLAFLAEGFVAIPGDLPGRLEQKIRFKSSFDGVRILIAGHHGSRTSSHPLWLRRLKNLKQVFVSARKEKYGHPHPLVAGRFRRNGVPLLSTNDWGTLKIEFRGNR